MDGSTVKLTELFKYPEDIEKVSALKLEFVRKKATVDAQLRNGLKEQLELTQSGMNRINDGHKTVQLIKDEMMKIDKLCAETQNIIRDFPNINLISQTHKNFIAVQTMKNDLQTFNDRLSFVENLLREDDQNPENMPNLLASHYELTRLRNIRDNAMEQIARADDPSLQHTLEDYFTRQDEVVEWFDEHIGMIAQNIINILINGSTSMIVRFAIIVEEEEKSDRRTIAMQEAMKDHGDMAARFQSITDGARTVRGYKEKFLKAIQLHADEQIADTKEAFLEEPKRLEKSFKWFFNDLNAIKQGMVPLMPKKWRIFQTYGEIYHKTMHDFLISMIDDPETSSASKLSILNWPEKYYSKMVRLGFKESDLHPHVLDNRESELVKEFQQLIISFLDQWLERIFKTEQKDLMDRNTDGGNLDTDEFGYFRTKSLVDMWRMLSEQIDAAANSQRIDVIEGVVDSIILRLQTRQRNWQELLDDEASKYSGNNPESEGLQALQDWLVASANDQISCIDDNEDEDRIAYVSIFRQKFEPLVSPSYLERVDEKLMVLRDGYVDLSTHFVVKFAQLIFSVDFRTVIPEFFTAKWYSATAMKQIIVTFEEYIGDYKTVLHYSLLDIFIEELNDQLLICYLSSVRNKGVKFKRQDPFKDKMFNDISVAFEFFNNNAFLSSDVSDVIRQKWRITENFLALIEIDKSLIPDFFVGFKTDYWDLQLSWVEAVLRSRDDYDRNLLNAVKAKAAQIETVRGPETLMSKIK